jgi:hypothetical protein
VHEWGTSNNKEDDYSVDLFYITHDRCGFDITYSMLYFCIVHITVKKEMIKRNHEYSFKY